MNERLSEIASAVAQHLGWQVLESDEEMRRQMRILQHPSGASIRLWVPYNSKRLEVSGDFPSDGKGNYYKPREGDWSISLSLEKPLDKIARDIEKRLVIGYLPAFDKASQQMRADQGSQHQAEGWARELADILGAAISSHGELKFYSQNPTGDFEVYRDGTVRMRLSVSVETAKRILREITSVETGEMKCQETSASA